MRTTAMHYLRDAVDPICNPSRKSVVRDVVDPVCHPDNDVFCVNDDADVDDCDVVAADSEGDDEKDSDASCKRCGRSSIKPP